MKRAAAAARRVAGVLGAGSMALVGLSWHALAAAIVITVIVIAAVLWTIAKADRSQHLALLISACRGRQAPSWPLPETAPPHQNSQATASGSSPTSSIPSASETG